MTVDYWREMQQKLLRGEVPELRMYPENCKLSAPAHDPEPAAG